MLHATLNDFFSAAAAVWVKVAEISAQEPSDAIAFGDSSFAVCHGLDFLHFEMHSASYRSSA
jgi:hypothetical protein